MDRWSEPESDSDESRSSQTLAWVSLEEGQNLWEMCWGKAECAQDELPRSIGKNTCLSKTLYSFEEPV